MIIYCKLAYSALPRPAIITCYSPSMTDISLMITHQIMRFAGFRRRFVADRNEPTAISILAEFHAHLASHWIAALWMAFAAAFNASLRWLKSRLGLGGAA